MAQRDVSGFKATKNARYAANTSGDISSGDGADMFEDTADSFLNITDHAYKSFIATAAGTNTYTATLNPAITSYATDQRYFIQFTNANTGASTLNLNALGAKSIVKNGSTALASGDITAGQIYILAYDGTNLQILGISGAGISGLTSGRVPYANSATTITDEAGFEYNAAGNVLKTPKLQLTTGITGSTGLSHGRASTGSIPAGTSSLVNVTLGSTMADTNYTVSAVIEDSTASASSLRVVHIESKSTTQVGVRVENTSAGAITGSIHIIVIHD